MNILTIFFCLAVFTVVNCKNLRIIGGEYADIREFPYTVSLQIIKDKWYICGGAIISNWHVLTAAHCFIDIDYASVKIYVGTNESKNYTLPHRKIKSVKIHPKFSGKRKSRQNSKHDIAVVTVEPCIPFNEFQQEIDLPTVDIQPEQVAIFSGWGWSNFPEGEISERLKKISLKVLHNVECEGYFPFSIFDEQVCTLEGPDIGICFGDSGGPLVYNGQLIGICSFALPCARNHPDVYTRVYQYLDFIKSSMTMKHPMCCIPYEFMWPKPNLKNVATISIENLLYEDLFILARVARIIGGEDADIEEFPYVASLRFFPENLHFCGGAIISTWHIVTAAHCVKHLYLSEFRVCVGSNNNTNSNPCYKIQQVAIHPQFFNRIVESKAGHDIAVVTVDGYIVFNEFQNKIDLPTEDIHPDEKCITVGWGWTSFPFGELFERLQKTDMKIVSNEECTNKYPLTILKHQVCAFQREGVGTCFGDSGGPLVSNDKLIGIASFVHPCAKGDPDVFTRVYSYLDFIQTSMQTTNNLMCCLPL